MNNTGPIRIDLNADAGEHPEALANGSQEQLFKLITSANVACGGHAGDDHTMSATIQMAQRHGVALGAHPSYPDQADFGRRRLNMPPAQLAASIAAQVRILHDIAAAHGVTLRHIKPHGALYNTAAVDPDLARLIAEALADWRGKAVLVGLAGSAMLDVWRGNGFTVAAEAFADRRYEPDGTLRARSLPDALIADPDQAAEQALRIVRDHAVVSAGGTVVPIVAETLCVHGDTPGATAILTAVRQRLEAAGVHIQAL